MIQIDLFLLVIARLGGAMRILIVICCLSASAVLAQEYPVSGVWVAVDDRTAGAAGGACFTLKLLGINSIMAGSLPTVLIFSDGKRIEVRAGYLSEQSIQSIRGMTHDAFRFAELPSKRSRWFPWFRKQSHSLKMLDPVTIEFGNGATTTRFVKCSSKSSLL
jgi:hypothetical protein